MFTEAQGGPGGSSGDGAALGTHSFNCQSSWSLCLPASFIRDRGQITSSRHRWAELVILFVPRFVMSGSYLSYLCRGNSNNSPIQPYSFKHRFQDRV